MTDLKETLETTFSVEKDNQTSFRFFPICNEFNFFKVIDELTLLPSTKEDGKIKVAILFGESHFLSLLPALSRLVDLIILADIEEKLHAHNRHLLSTFRQADSISKFLRDYCRYFPSTPFQRSDTPNQDKIYQQVDILFGKKSRASVSLKQHYFLHSIQQYHLCKQALQNVSVAQIYLDLADNQACQTLAQVLETHQAQLTICNFTNIHQYVEANLLYTTTTSLLQYSQPQCVLSSTGPAYHLTVRCDSNKSSYLCALNADQSRSMEQSSFQHTFFQQPSKINMLNPDILNADAILTINTTFPAVTDAQTPPIPCSILSNCW